MGLPGVVVVGGGRAEGDAGGGRRHDGVVVGGGRRRDARDGELLGRALGLISDDLEFVLSDATHTTEYRASASAKNLVFGDGAGRNKGRLSGVRKKLFEEQVVVRLPVRRRLRRGPQVFALLRLSVVNDLMDGGSLLVAGITREHVIDVLTRLFYTQITQNNSARAGITEGARR